MLPPTVLLYSRFLREPGPVFDALRVASAWEQKSVTIYGKSIPQPRLIAWYGDPGTSYTYSGLRVDPNPWFPALASLKAEVERATGATFNSVLLNLYRNGSDSVAWHADDEPELGSNPTIASVSLGATRKFQLKHNLTKQVFSVDLTSGSLLVMSGSTQESYKHAVLKTTRPVGERINLTFRRIFS